MIRKREKMGQCVCLLMGLFVLGMWGSEEAKSVKKGHEVFAVLIGVNKYLSSSITPLKYTDRDVRALHNVLTGVGGIPKGNVRMLLNEKATGRAIREALKVWLPRKVKRAGRQGQVLVYFSGHGYAQSGTSYWLPYDTDIKNAETIEKTGVSSDHFNSWLSKRRLGSRSVVVFVDACNSGFAWSGSKDAMSGKYKKNLRKGLKSGLSGQGFGEGHAVVASSMQDQFSVEAETLQHGVFSYALVEALQGKADADRDGVVTLSEVWAYLSSRVEKLAMEHKRYPQRPVRSGVEAGAISLSYPGVRAGVQTGGASGVGSANEGKKEPVAGERKTITAGGSDFVMRWIPSGSFMMGSPAEETALVMADCKKSGDSEKKCKGWFGNALQRRVEISKGFWMLETEVTQGQWKALMGDAVKPHFKNCGEKCPMESVSWYEARAFANKLSKAVGLRSCPDTDRGIFVCEGWRLPTEAEWEYAARAGTTGATYNTYSKYKIVGENNAPHLDGIAWYSGNSGVEYEGGFDCSVWKKKQYESKHCGTHSVRGKRANAWGLHDMLGNVWEWTMDVYESSYTGFAMRDPLGTSSGKKRVFRGGSWNNTAGVIRTAFRDSSSSAIRYYSLGFRLVRY